MAIIHVRSISEDLVSQLQALAKGHHRSMEAEERVILAEAVQPPPIARGTRHLNFDLIAKTELGDVVFESMSPTLREVVL